MQYKNIFISHNRNGISTGSTTLNQQIFHLKELVKNNAHKIYVIYQIEIIYQAKCVISKQDVF